jgi:8-oxo-dGTP pyrophosphatase MutT (NUDIX family)
MDSRFVRAKAEGLARRVRGLSPFLRAVARRRSGRWYVSAVAVILDDANRVLIAEHVFRNLTWALPGGWVNAREDPDIAIRREVMEETGLAVDVVAVVAVERHGEGGPDVGYNGLTLAYLCRPAPDSSAAATSVEIRAVRWVDVGSVAGLVTPFEHQAVLAAVARAAS